MAAPLVAEGIIAAITAIASLFGGKSGTEGIDPAMMAQLQGLLRVQKQNYLYTDPGAAGLLDQQAPEGAVPLRRSVNAMAYALLPKWARGEMPSLESTRPNTTTQTTTNNPGGTNTNEPSTNVMA